MTYHAARGARRAGLSRVATRLCLAADVVTVTPPFGRAFGLHRLDGRDQIANAFGNEGWWGFERPLPDVFGRLAKDTSGLVVDVGANTGFYAVLAAVVAPQARVVAFEPYPPAASILHENARLNLVKTIDLRPVALGR